MIFIPGRAHMTKSEDRKLLCRVFILYIIILLFVIMFRCGIEEFIGKYNGIVLQPFSDKYNYTSKLARNLCYIGNIVCFIPAGIYLTLLFEKCNGRIKKYIFSMLCIIGMSLFIEVMQYILVIGMSSTTDLIQNTTGGAIGIVLYILLRKLISDNIIFKINKWTCFVLIGIDIIAIFIILANINLYLNQ